MVVKVSLRSVLLEFEMYWYNYTVKSDRHQYTSYSMIPLHFVKKPRLNYTEMLII